MLTKNLAKGYLSIHTLASARILGAFSSGSAEISLIFYSSMQQITKILVYPV